MIETIFTNKVYYALIIAIKVLYAIAICVKCKSFDRKTRNALTFLSIPFPIITGIICIIKYKKSIKDIIIILITLIFSVISLMTVSFIYTYNNHVKYYDKDGAEHIYASDVIFTDAEGNKYTFDFEKTGYDILYINSTDEYLDADFCYLDSEGYIYYDDDISITAKDESCCVDEDGSLYYPAKFTTFNKDGTIKYVFNSANFRYDRLGNAYTRDFVPYYDADGNKYSYSFDSTLFKGIYTNISTGKTFENEYSFVDENGYFVYDKEHNFIEQKDIKNVKAYMDSAGKMYYWASDISWDEKGNLLDSFGEIIK